MDEFIHAQQGMGSRSLRAPSQGIPREIGDDLVSLTSRMTELTRHVATWETCGGGGGGRHRSNNNSPQGCGGSQGTGGLTNPHHKQEGISKRLKDIRVACRVLKKRIFRGKIPTLGAPG